MIAPCPGCAKPTEIAAKYCITCGQKLEFANPLSGADLKAQLSNAALVDSARRLASAEDLTLLIEQFKVATMGNDSHFGSSPVDPQVSRELITRFSQIANDPNNDLATRQNFSALTDQVAGYALSFWLPRGFGRKFVMLIGTMIALTLAIKFNPFWLCLLVFVASFSPRVVGHGARCLGSVFKG